MYIIMYKPQAFYESHYTVLHNESYPKPMKEPKEPVYCSPKTYPLTMTDSWELSKKARMGYSTCTERQHSHVGRAKCISR